MEQQEIGNLSSSSEDKPSETVYVYSGLQKVLNFFGKRGTTNELVSPELSEMADYLLASFTDGGNNALKPFLIKNLENLKTGEIKQFNSFKKFIESKKDLTSSSKEFKKLNYIKYHNSAGQLITQSNLDYLKNIESNCWYNESLAKLGIGCSGLQCFVLFCYSVGALPPLLNNC